MEATAGASIIVAVTKQSIDVAWFHSLGQPFDVAIVLPIIWFDALLSFATGLLGEQPKLLSSERQLLTGVMALLRLTLIGIQSSSPSPAQMPELVDGRVQHVGQHRLVVRHQHDVDIDETVAFALVVLHDAAAR